MSSLLGSEGKGAGRDALLDGESILTSNTNHSYLQPGKRTLVVTMGYQWGRAKLHAPIVIREERETRVLIW